MSVPNPSTTDWVPLQGKAGAAYFGQYQASGHTYYDGDCVIGSDGILYMCVTDGTTTPPVAWPGAPAPQGVAGPQGPQGVGIPMPVVNGSWIKGVGGAAVWTPLSFSEIPIIPACRFYSTAQTFIANGAYVPVTGMNVEDYDTDNMHSGSDNFVTIRTPGIYLFEAKALFQGAVGGNHRLISFTFASAGGTSPMQWAGSSGVVAGSFAAGSVRLLTTMVRRCVVNDWASLNVYQDSGSSLGLYGDGVGGPEMTATYLGRGA